MEKQLVIALDFDGTCVENEYPEIGREREHCADVIRLLKQAGAKIILWTCRDGKELSDAVEWFSERDIELDAVNDNLPEVIESYGFNPRKIVASLYVDDKGYNPIGPEGAYSDWDKFFLYTGLEQWARYRLNPQDTTSKTPTK